MFSCESSYGSCSTWLAIALIKSTDVPRATPSLTAPRSPVSMAHRWTADERSLCHGGPMQHAPSSKGSSCMFDFKTLSRKGSHCLTG